MLNQEYDAVIVGAGIGGLVCGCYLAKAGKKVLIIEKNGSSGGYCRSFKVDNLNFDLCARSLSSLRVDGSLNRVIKELGLTKKIKFERSDPSDVIITPHFKICFWNDFDRTLREFKMNFPNESYQIEQFFNSIRENPKLASLAKITFEEFLNRYFSNHILKTILAFPIFGNVGLPASHVSASSAIILYKELMLDGGYHPELGMGQVSDVLTDRFREYGGEIVFSSKAKQILLKHNSVDSVLVDKGIDYRTRYVISDIDPRQTYFDLIKDEKILDSNFINELSQFKPSLSHFILYLGFNVEVSLSPTGSHNIWYLTEYNLERMYAAAIKGRSKELDWLLFSVGKERRNIMAFMNVSFLNRKFWIKNRAVFTKHIIKLLEELFPNISNHIIYKFSATPIALANWTSSFKGASYGWEASPSQIAKAGFLRASPIKNLYLCSQWTTLAYGIAGVSYLGKYIANLIIKND